MLDRLAARYRRAHVGDRVEKGLGRLTGDNSIGHSVCVALVAISNFTNAVLELHAAPLLHHVRGLVRGSVHVRRSAEANIVAERKANGSHGVTRRGSAPAHVCTDSADIMMAERRLYAIGVRDPDRHARDSLGSGLVYLGVSVARRGRRTTLTKVIGVVTKRALHRAIARLAAKFWSGICSPVVRRRYRELDLRAESRCPHSATQLR